MAEIDCLGMAANSTACDFKPVRFKRRAVGDEDVLIEMKYCGVCHSDCAWLKNEVPMVMGSPAFPEAIPGHELAGICTAVGKKVTKIKVGDQVGVGCMVDSCLTCDSCKEGRENWCKNSFCQTYGGANAHGRARIAGGRTQTQGGYCNQFVVHEHFAIKIPSTYPLEAAGPMMCAGVTVYDPMKHAGVGPGTQLGVVGLGGLGVTAIKIAKALGATVTAISRSEAKRQLAMDQGASAYIATSNVEHMKQASASLDLILNTIPNDHDWTIYQPLLSDARGGKQVLLGLHHAQIAAFALKSTGCSVTMSGIGGIPATQEIIDLADEHNIIPHTKVVPITELNRIFEACDAGNDAGIRYVLDIANTLTDAAFDSISCGDPPKLQNHPALSILGVIREVFKMLFSEVICNKCSPQRKAD